MTCEARGWSLPANSVALTAWSCGMPVSYGPYYVSGLQWHQTLADPHERRIWRGRRGGQCNRGTPFPACVHTRFLAQIRGVSRHHLLYRVWGVPGTDRRAANFYAGFLQVGEFHGRQVIFRFTVRCQMVGDAKPKKSKRRTNQSRHPEAFAFLWRLWSSRRLLGVPGAVARPG